MKVVKKLLLAVLLFAFHVQGQNLVVNPGFEENATQATKGWPTGDPFTDYSVKGWTQTTMGTTDYYFSDKNGRMNFLPYAGKHDPAGGKAFAGFIHWLPGREYREYLSGELKQPLEKGKKYIFRLKICTGSSSPYMVSELGVYFSETRYQDKKIKGVIPVQPQVWLDVTPMHRNPETWIEVKNVFTATGNERYFTVGNFLNDSSTKVTTRKADGMFCEYAYYYADDAAVELTTEDPVLPGKKTALSDHIEAGKTFIARGINFDLDQATLRPESYIQLHEIAAELKRKPGLKIDIRGYTDSTGNETHNLQLSRARAKAVADYLISTGIDKSRITYGGYGSANPVSSIDPALNRRVEFVFR